MKLNQVVLKITSICNLSCKYCYVYNKNDKSYEIEPNFISDNIVDSLLNEIERHCKDNKISDFHIVLHGGEPLLIGKDFMINFMNKCNNIIKSTKISVVIQTNGTLLSKEWCELFKELNIGVGVSLDGTESSNINRVFKNKIPAYNQIIKGIDLLKISSSNFGVLSVININEDSKNFYAHLKMLNIDYIDILLPHENYDSIIPNKDDFSEWMIDLFDIWYSDSNRINIRSFGILLSLILGYECNGNEAWGIQNNSIITIKTDGNIQLVDSLKICGDNFTRTNLNITTNKIDEIFDFPLYKSYYYAHQDSYLCNKCKKCIVKNLCGGGQLAHRYSNANGFENPSIYCYQIFKLIVHVQNKICDDFINEVNVVGGIDKLTLEDYQ